MLGARLFRSVISGANIPLEHFDHELTLNELLKDPMTLAVATSDGLSPRDLKTMVCGTVAYAKDKPHFPSHKPFHFGHNALRTSSEAKSKGGHANA